MKKFFSLVLALVMALSLTTVAWGAVDNATDLQTAFTAGGDVVLSGDIAATSTLTVPAGVTVNLDLAGYDISASGLTYLISVANTATLNISDSSVDETGEIILTSTPDTYSATIYVEGTLNLYSGTITMTGSKYINYAVDVRPNAWGTAYTEGSVFHMYGGTLNSSESAVRVSSSSSTSYTAVSATFIMDGGVINAVKDGVFVQAQGETYPVLTADVNGGKIDADRNAVYVYGPAATGSVGNVADPINVTLDGGEYEGTIKVKDTVTTDSVEFEISAGTFAVAPDKALLADGVQLLANGSVVPETAAGDTSPVLYVWDNAAVDWATYYIATGMTLDKLAQDSSDNCLPCYLINGGYFVETTAASATFKLVYGAKTVYLTLVAPADVCYVDTASVLTVVDAEDAECGDYYVTNLDEDDVYYVSYDKKGVVDGIWVKAKNGPVQILVGDAIVNVKVATVNFMDHDWEGYEVVNKAYVSVKCSECDKVAKLYANATAAGKKAVPVLNGAGWITYADATDFGTTVVTPTTPSTDVKVESAETFDAGIAMYVGMSVMAAAGSAVVLKKKED